MRSSPARGIHRRAPHVFDVDRLFGQALARPPHDVVEHSAHVLAPFDAAISSSSFASAFPLTIALRARMTPSRIESAAPATYSAAPAFSATTSCVAPLLPPRIDRAIDALVFTSPPARSSMLCVSTPPSAGVISYERT